MSGVIVLPPTTIGTALFVGAIVPGLVIVDTDVPTCRTVSDGPVDKAINVFNDPSPIVMDDPGTSV